MEESDEKDQRNKKFTEVITFPVPFLLIEIKENIILNTNISDETSKEKIINQAFKFHSEGEIAKATKYYQQFLNQGFTDHRVFSNYGIILRNNCNLKEAELLQRKAIALNPDYAEAHSSLGNILRDLGNLKEAKLSVLKAIELNPDYAEAHSNLGNILRDLGNFKEAELSVLKAIELNPDYAEAHSNLGNISRDLGKLKEAELSQRKAIELNPNYAEAHSNLGIILGDLGNLKEAELSQRKAIELNPDYAEAHSNLSNILSVIGNLKEAELLQRKAIELKPDFADAHLNLANILKDLGSLKEAELSVRKAIEVKPNLSHAYFRLSLLMIDVVNDKLLKYLFSEEIIDSKENSSKLNQADIYFARGNILERKKNYKESYKMFRIANILTRKKFRSNFKVFKKALEIDSSIVKEIKDISLLENKDKDLPVPIFTVGLPRAGKSTTESILSTNKLLIKFGDRKGISEIIRDYKNIEKSFRILGIQNNPTYKEIRDAYLKLAKQYHPDKGGDKKLMAKILEGYKFLKNEYEDKEKDYIRPNLYKFFIQKLGIDIDSNHYTCHTSPNNILYTGVIASQIPKSKIIYCYRNPKDHVIELYKYNLKNYLSLKTSIFDLAKIIVKIETQMEEYKTIFKSKIYFLNFDKLILEPKREIQSLLNWLNWKYDDKYLTPKLMPKGIIKSRNDINNLNSSYIHNGNNYKEMLKPIEGIFSTLKRKNNDSLI